MGHDELRGNRGPQIRFPIGRILLFAAVVAEAWRRQLLSAEHFTVDGTLLDAWASLKSYRPRDEEDGPRGGGRNAETSTTTFASLSRWTRPVAPCRRATLRSGSTSRTFTTTPFRSSLIRYAITDEVTVLDKACPCALCR